MGLMYVSNDFVVVVVCYCYLLWAATGAVAVGFADFGPGTGPILVSNVQCNGSESRLVDCSYAPRRSCEHFDDAGVICRGT